LETRYDQIARRESWWQGRKLWHRPRLTRNVVLAFLIFLVIALLRGRTSFAYSTFDSDLTIKTSDLIALAVALVVAFIESTRRDPKRTSK
jgi:di/tricarboxylate transporter